MQFDVQHQLFENVSIRSHGYGAVELYCIIRRGSFVIQPNLIEYHWGGQSDRNTCQCVAQCSSTTAQTAFPKMTSQNESTPVSTKTAPCSAH